MNTQLRCLDCSQTAALESARVTCKCGGLLDVVQNLTELKKINLKKIFDERIGGRDELDRSGVWRFRELLIESKNVISRAEGNTRLYPVPQIGEPLGVDLFFKHEGENPTGSFKDRGMTVAITAGAAAGYRTFVCASTGNTSASLASYCATAGMNGIVIIPAGKIAYGKLSQSLAYGAKVLQIEGDFDAAMKLVAQLGKQFDAENPAKSIYILNSVNPFRIEGQKTIVFEMLQQLGWKAPDWITLPAGNLGNTSAFGKAIEEAFELGLIDRKPRIAAVQAAGANPFFTAFTNGFPEKCEPVVAETIATAVKIGDPVSYPRAVRAIRGTDGIVLQATDEEIMDAKATIDAVGIGCEPASACTLAGIRQLVANGEMKKGETVVGILTGHLLKDPDATINYHLNKLGKITPKRANQPITIEPTVEAVLAAIKS